MESVVAKFYVHYIEDKSEHQQKTVHFNAVASGCEENKSFSKYTPSGTLTMVISYDTKAVDFFEQGKEYYLNFTHANNE